MSHPARVRGLKLPSIQCLIVAFFVAPCTGAWIEILTSVPHSCVRWVAPCTGAWIEIVKSIHWIVSRGVAPCTGAWIEIVLVWKTASQFGRTLHGCVDWNNRRKLEKAMFKSRTLHGCVDWNFSSRIPAERITVSHPARVRGLKSIIGPFIGSLHESHPARVRGLK